MNGTTPSVEQFVKLLTAHEVRLRAYALSLVGNWNDADEVLQQASIVMWRKFDQFTLGTNFLGWGCRVVNLIARDLLKRRRRDRVRFTEAFFDALADEVEQVSDVMAARESALGLCLDKLSPEHRELLRLRYDENQSIDGVASVLGRTVQAVYQSLSRVRRALFDCVTRQVRLADAK